MTASANPVPTEPTTAEKLRKLPWSIGANSANIVFTQLTFFGSVFVLFLNELNLEKTQIGFLLSLIPFSSFMALFIAPLVARFGYKRIYLTFFFIRTFFTLLLLLTPFIVAMYGPQITLYFIAAVILAFALCRAVAVTAAFPWIQEYVPASVRGRYSATNSIFTTLTGLVTLVTAGQVIERVAGLNGFMILISVGIGFGFVTVWAASFIPGGAAVRRNAAAPGPPDNLGEVLRDTNFRRYLLGFGLIGLSFTPLNAFLPLFMQEEVGLSTGNIILLQTGTMTGSLLSSYLWGWAADRYGSKPVMMTGIIFLLTLPIAWMLMPRNDSSSLYVALGIAFAQGIAAMGWGIGSGRLLYVSVVPPEKKSSYMSAFYAGSEFMAGTSQVVGGQLLALTAGVGGQFFFLRYDPYTILFVLALILPVISLLVFSRVQADNRVSTFEFAGMFLRGNPLLAMESVMQYQFATSERAAISVTERLGQTQSTLAVDELLDSLADPRFNVRFEAVISIARTRPDSRLTEALVRSLKGSEISLSVVSAWALGRIGDEQATQALRDGLNAPYRSIQAHCARALGTIRDEPSRPILLERLERETDKGLQMAYASALGNLGATEAVDTLLRVIGEFRNRGARMELALSLARITGDERSFIRLFRQARHDPGTVLAQVLTGLRRRVARRKPNGREMAQQVERCAEALAQGDLDVGADRLVALVETLPPDLLSRPQYTVLQAAVTGMRQVRGKYLDWLLLTVHLLELAWQKNGSEKKT